MRRHVQARCYPSADREFEADVVAAIYSLDCDPDAVLVSLRAKYPELRIAVRDALADFGPDDVWYCYRDGKVVWTSDGVGAMRLWTTLERETRRSLDLIETASDLMRRSGTLVAAARQARHATRAGRPTPATNYISADRPR